MVLSPTHLVEEASSDTAFRLSVSNTDLATHSDICKRSSYGGSLLCATRGTYRHGQQGDTCRCWLTLSDGVEV